MKPFLYVHTPPETFGLADSRRDRGDVSYAAELIFLDRILADWSVRTRDLREARLFYVPTFAYHRLSNTIFNKASKHVDELVREMRSDTAFRTSWSQQNASSRHVFFFTTDKGACTTARGASEPIYISHWGLKVPWFEQLAPLTWVPNATDLRPLSRPCATARHDIVVPPLIGTFPLWKQWQADHARAEAAKARAAAAAAAAAPAEADVPATAAAPAEEAAAAAVGVASGATVGPLGGGDAGIDTAPIAPSTAAATPLTPRSWSCLLFFAGTAERGGGSVCGTNATDGRPLRCYSQGVRQALFQHHAGRAGFCVSQRTHRCAQTLDQTLDQLPNAATLPALRVLTSPPLEPPREQTCPAGPSAASGSTRASA